MPSFSFLRDSDSFERAWTLADTERALATWRSVAAPIPSPDPKQEERSKHACLLAFQAALGRHVLHLARTTGLEEPAHGQAVRTPFLEAWRMAMAGGPLETHLLERLGRLGDRFEFFLLENPTASAQEVHQALVGYVTAGNFRGAVNEECFVSGHFVLLEMTKWVPRLEIFRLGDRRSRPLRAGEIQAPCLQGTVIPVPTGQLLVTGAIDHPAFREAVDTAIVPRPSLNSDAGRVMWTHRLAKELGVATVWVGDGCACVVANGGGVRVGRPCASGRAMDGVVGRVNGSWLTLVDEQVLVDVFARSMALPEARSEVALLVNSAGDFIHRIAVPPGEHHLYFAGSPDTFSCYCRDVSGEWDGFGEPVLALQPAMLAPRPPAQRGSKM